MTAGSAGDVGVTLVDYSTSGMRAVMEATFSKTSFRQSVPAAARDTAAAHPAATSLCGPS